VFVSSTELNNQVDPIAPGEALTDQEREKNRQLAKRAVQRVGVATHFVLIGCRHCEKLGRLVPNMCIPMGQFILEFAAKYSSVQFM